MEPSPVLRVLGVDPGTIRMGYGVVDACGDSLQVLAYGVLKAPSSVSLEKRLGALYQGLLSEMGQWCPTSVAVEEPFVGRNARSSLAVGRAEALVLLAAYQHSLPVYHHSPAEVKLSVTDYGRSSKQQVQQMVGLFLNIPDTIPSDAADALAVALCHLRSQRLPPEMRP